MKINLFENILNKQFDFNKIVEEFQVINTLKQIPQNPKYHGEGNVYIHTKYVCNELLNLKEWSELSNEQKVILYLGALFHDIGKIICTKIEDGEIKSSKHAVKGAKLFRELVYKEYVQKYIIDFKTREQIAALIRYHGLPLAGKDTYIKENLNYMNVVSLDDIREEFNVSPMDNSSKIVMIAKDRAKEYLRLKQPFIWNATNIISDTRKKLCNLFSSYGARVKFIYIEAPYNELISRNKIRDRSIPLKVLNNMIHNLI